MAVEISVDQSKNEFNNPTIKKGDFIIDIEGNIYLTGSYNGHYVISLSTGVDSYNKPETMPENYKKLKKDDIIKIAVV